MNLFIIVSALVVLGILVMAVRSDKSMKMSDEADSSSKKKEENTDGPVEPLSTHDAAVWLDEFLAQQQSAKSDDTHKSA